MDIEEEIAGLRFDALRNAIYHTSRRMFLDRCNRILNLIVILAGAGAVGQMGHRLGTDDQMLAVVATLAGTLQLVFDLGVKARDHEFLQRQYYEILAQIAEYLNPGEDQVRQWQAQMQRLYSEEPPQLRALDAIAYNAACDSLGKDHGRLRVAWWQSLVRHLYPFNGTSFPPVRITRVAVSKRDEAATTKA